MAEINIKESDWCPSCKAKLTIEGSLCEDCIEAENAVLTGCVSILLFALLWIAATF
jgi:predicted amidophosphoribosyltransferase